MLRVHASGLWNVIAELSARATTGRAAAVAYFTSEDSVRFARGDLLIVDASDATIARGATSARRIQQLVARGVRVYSLPGLHAKVYLLGNTAVVGSANLTANSHNLVEAAVVSDLPEVVAGAAYFIESLRSHAAAIEVDAGFVARALTIPVVKPTPTGRAVASNDPTLIIPAHRTWLLGLHAVDPEEFPGEETAAEAGTTQAARLMKIVENNVEWIRYSRSWRFAREAQQGETIIQIWREDYRDERPTHVYRATPIVLRQEEPTCVRFFARPQAQRVTWAKFRQLWNKLGLERLPGQNAQRLLSKRIADTIDSLWDDA